jgi:hypothetical protein
LNFNIRDLYNSAGISFVTLPLAFPIRI